MSTHLLSFWTVPSEVLKRLPSEPATSAALELLVCVATATIPIFNQESLFAHVIDDDNEDNILGSGGFAVVKRGQTRKGLVVAIKENRPPLSAPGQDDSGSDRQLKAFCLELRILCHESLKSHRNIIDVLGICLEQHANRPVLCLILEYSAHGTLKDFLVRSEEETDMAGLLDYISQVGCGLEALHRLKVCHGDVKIQNCLVFMQENATRIAVSDFGQSIVAPHHDQSARVTWSFGTRLYNAPEIRNGAVGNCPCFNIDDALRTDVYSFGLLAWEVLKRGDGFFDPTWMQRKRDTLDIDTMEEYLNQLPLNGLLAKSVEYLQSTNIESIAREHIMNLFESVLQDKPDERPSMSTLRGATKDLDNSSEYE